MSAVLITAAGAASTIDGGYESIKTAIGGWLELAPVPGAPFVMYVNEEGKLNGLPYNARANNLANRFRTWDDPLCGNVVLVGPPTAAGDDTSYTLTELLELESL